MLRAVLVGLLAVSATSSCGGGGDTEKVAPGAVAGTVLEASGSVAATRHGASRALAAGAEVFADDLIDTANGSVVILLRHNNARWAVEGGQRLRVDESLAWKLAKQDGPAKVVDHASSAAGREGERAAADTRATAESAKAVGAAAPEGAAVSGAAAQPAPIPPPADTGAEAKPAPSPSPPDSDGVASKATGDAPPAPPRTAGDKAVKGGPGGGGPARSAARSPEGQLRSALEARRAELRRCAGRLALTLVVRVDQGAPRIELGGAAASAQVRACLERVVQRIPMDGLTATASIELAP